MDFSRRLRLYGFGFVLGIMLVYGIFGTRSCTSPNELKMQELVFQKFALSPKALCKLKCLKKNEMLLKVELRHFEVNYDASSIHKKPFGDYYIQAKKEFASEHPYALVIQDCDTISRIDDIQILNNNSCNCQ
jgi:hypothetical protein